MAELPSADGIQGVEDREAGVGTPETEAEEDDDAPASEPGGGTQDVADDPTSLPDDETSTVVFEEDTDSTPEPSDVKGIVTNDATEERVQEFAEQQVRAEQDLRTQSGFSGVQEKAQPSRTNENDLRTASLIQRSTNNEFGRSLASRSSGRDSRVSDGRDIFLSDTSADSLRDLQSDKVSNANRIRPADNIDRLDKLAAEQDSALAANVVGVAEGARTFGEESLELAEQVVTEPIGTAKAIGSAAFNAVSNPGQTLDAISESGKDIGDTLEQRSGPGRIVGQLAGETALGFGAGKAAEFTFRQGRRAAARLNPKFRGVETAESGAQKIDVDGLTERDDVERIELVQPGGAGQVDEAQAAAEGFGKEAREGAFTKDLVEQFEDARRLSDQDSITITSAQAGLTDTGLSKALKGSDTELRNPSTIEEAREIAETGEPLDALFFASPPTKSGNPVARKSRLGTQDTRGISGIGLPKREKPQILIDEDADLKNIFEDSEIGDLAQRAAEGDEQAARELVQSERFKELQFEQDEAFTPIGFDSPESELTTNAPILRDEGRIGLSDVDGEVVDIRRVSTVDPDNPSGVSDDVAEALDEAETPGDVEDITRSSDELISSKQKADARFSPAKASGEAAGLATTQFASVDTDRSVPESTVPDASVPSNIYGDTAEVASDVFPDSDQTSNIPSSPSAPTVQSAVSGSSPGEPSTPSVPSSPSQPSDTSSPVSGLSTGGSSTGGGSSGGSSGGGSSGGSGGGSGGTPGGGRRRRRDDDSDRRPDDVDVQIGRPGNDIFKEFEDLPFSEAKKILKKGVKGTAAASGKIVDEQGNPVEAPSLRNEFDKRENGFFVEPLDERIQSRGEKQDITFEGLEEQASQARSRRSNVFTEQSVPGLEKRQSQGVGFEKLQADQRSDSLGRGPFFDADDDKDNQGSFNLPSAEDVL